MTLKEQIAADCGSDGAFFNTDDFAETCSYTQGNLAPFNIVAIAHKVDYLVADSEGFATQFAFTDFDIPIESLGEVVPRDGDRINRTLNGVEEIYEVLPIDDVRPSVARDETGNIYILHTRRVAR